MSQPTTIPKTHANNSGEALPVTGNGNGNGNHGGLIDRLIESQQQLTAVERFSQRYESITSPALESTYRHLIPHDLPGEDEQYSFEVDLDACSGCKACVAACHNLNGLEDGELWRNVGLLVGGSEPEPMVQHVTAACHHCLEPACMHGCPVKAYEKDPVTGIVAHLDDQCIGCKYCMFMCPYDVPSYSKSKGIVRKCNMCTDRLAVGEAPACVQACPNEAIKIRKVSREQIIDASETDQLVPGAPDVQLTLPTTRYNTTRVMPRNLLPDDYYISKPLHAHFPLVFMLTFTQMALGIFAIGFVVSQLWPDVSSGLFARLDVIGFATLVAGLNVAILHLGRPLKAYRAMGGIKTSWLSREIAGFNGFAAAATALLAWGWLALPEQMTGIGRWLPALATTLAGIAAVVCSAMLYIVTKRPLWTSFRTNSLFFLTAAVLGTVSVLAATHWLASDTSIGRLLGTETAFTDVVTLNGIGTFLAKALILFVIAKLCIEVSLLTNLASYQYTPQRHAARLMTGDLRRITIVRFGLGLAGGVLIPILFLIEPVAGDVSDLPLAMLTIAFAMLLVAELMERYLFFATSVARRMPGAPN